MIDSCGWKVIKRDRRGCMVYILVESIFDTDDLGTAQGDLGVAGGIAQSGRFANRLICFCEIAITSPMIRDQKTYTTTRNLVFICAECLVVVYIFWYVRDTPIYTITRNQAFICG